MSVILVRASLEEVLDLYSWSLAWVLTSRSVRVLNPLRVTVARKLVCRLRVALSDTFKVSILSISLCAVLSLLDQLRSTLYPCTKYPLLDLFE
jgi:hypothetical protein